MNQLKGIITIVSAVVTIVSTIQKMTTKSAPRV
ncbi:hypothetical protein FSU_2022 [Fibrobacter succinogenes subsp. succinogenes S85]|uniref:Uncharacterized protein n=1 Tax=Fibrobacter succinogenes (strain ATCC 19169 / S85) TaxID=59374 RepID=C9RRF1_FIBSS|nr:hypothetical protein Fisuc_1540 [Fibrobacter succinogenes subsp. succinogenes S85]ADL25535.1 hypothetical protein FSU_2022 [Fibrobacter succinogenes subsp. succinogenes S85]